MVKNRRYYMDLERNINASRKTIKSAKADIKSRLKDVIRIFCRHSLVCSKEYSRAYDGDYDDDDEKKPVSTYYHDFDYTLNKDTIKISFYCTYSMERHYHDAIIPKKWLWMDDLALIYSLQKEKREYFEEVERRNQEELEDYY